MPQFVPVSRERHQDKRWIRPKGYVFAAAEAVVPMVGAELSRAASSMPLAFAKHDGGHTLIAVLSMTPGRNLFVAPDGRWLGAYVPAYFRTYPFRMIPKRDADEALLCVDEAIGLATDPQTNGEPFFDNDGKPVGQLQNIFNILIELERSRRATDVAVSALSESDVIQPWQLTLKTERGEQSVGGLHHIDENKLNALSDEAFAKLRKASAVPVAYAQLFSTAQLGIFSQLEKIQAQLTPPPLSSLPESLDSLFGLSNDDTIQFR